MANHLYDTVKLRIWSYDKFDDTFLSEIRCLRSHELIVEKNKFNFTRQNKLLLNKKKMEKIRWSKIWMQFYLFIKDEYCEIQIYDIVVQPKMLDRSIDIFNLNVQHFEVAATHLTDMFQTTILSFWFDLYWINAWKILAPVQMFFHKWFQNMYIFSHIFLIYICVNIYLSKFLVQH